MDRAKKNILDKIRKGLKTAQFEEFYPKGLSNKEIFVTPDIPLIELFKLEIEKVSGEFFVCSDVNEIIKTLEEIHSKYNLDLCYSPDDLYLKIIEEAKIPFTTKFENTEKIRSGISSCEFLVARYGSVMVSSALPGARKIFVFPEIHIVIADESQLVLELHEAFDGIKKKYNDSFPSQITNIAGPSRTADIEKTLVLGAHGPKKFIVIIKKGENTVD